MSDTESFAATTAIRQEMIDQETQSTAPTDEAQFSEISTNGADINGSQEVAEDASPEPSTGAKGGSSNSTLAEITRSQFETLKGYHSEVLGDQPPEAIHKMRVTTRRLQASLDLLQSNGDEFRIRRLKKRLRAWRRVLSVVRNYDVFLELIEKESEGRKPHVKKQFDPLKSVLRNRRSKIADKASSYLKNINMEGLGRNLGFDKEPDESNKKGDENKDEEKRLFDESRIARRTAERLEQRLAEFIALAVQGHPTSDPADLHNLRIAAKRLRYLLETVGQMGVGDTEKSLTWLRSIQDRIGDWHDLQAIEEEIISIVTRRKFVSSHFDDAIKILQVASQLKKKKEKLLSKILPVRVPRTLTSNSMKLAKSLRRQYSA